MVFRDGDLYGVTANRIARCDGTNWFSLGSGPANGVGGQVLSLDADETGVYVGGLFSTAGGQPALRIVKWGQPTLPTLNCPADIVVTNLAGGGQEVVIAAEAGHPCGNPLTVIFNVDGGPAEQTNLLAVGITDTPASIPLTNTYTPGTHTVVITVDDGATPPQACSF